MIKFDEIVSESCKAVVNKELERGFKGMLCLRLIENSVYIEDKFIILTFKSMLSRYEVRYDRNLKTYSVEIIG